jgi:hypothetical protein
MGFSRVASILAGSFIAAATLSSTTNVTAQGGGAGGGPTSAQGGEGPGHGEVGAAPDAGSVTPPKSAGQGGAPDIGNAERAQELFAEGRDAYVDQDYALALDRFRASHALVPSPNSRLFIARCLRELGQFSAAYAQYEILERETEASEKYEKTHEAAAAERAALDERVARVAIGLPADVEDAEVTVNGKKVDRALIDEPMVVTAGKVEVEVTAPGRKPYRWAGLISAGETRDLDVRVPLKNPPPPPPPPPEEGTDLRPFAIGAAGLGAVNLALWGILGVAAANRHADLEEQCGGRCTARFQDEVDAGRRETLLSSVGLVVGVIGIAGGVTLWILSDHDAPDERPPVRARIETDGSSVTLVMPF